MALHEVTWSSEDVYDEKAEIEERAQGRGIGRGFIRTLSTGDRVGVVARARVCFNLGIVLLLIKVLWLVAFVAESCVWRQGRYLLFPLAL